MSVYPPLKYREIWDLNPYQDLPKRSLPVIQEEGGGPPRFSQYLPILKLYRKLERAEATSTLRSFLSKRDISS